MRNAILGNDLKFPNVCTPDGVFNAGGFHTRELTVVFKPPSFFITQRLGLGDLAQAIQLQALYRVNTNSFFFIILLTA